MIYLKEYQRMILYAIFWEKYRDEDNAIGKAVKTVAQFEIDLNEYIEREEKR